MSYIEILAYKCTCERCAHSWTAIALPRTCSKCRSPYWNIARGNKLIPVSVPLAAVVVDKEDELSGLRNLIKSVESKPKSDYYTKPVVPTYEDQPDPYSEPTYNYD
jgi:hypothetical protein